MSSQMAQWPPAGNTYPLATFAAGCFWGVELVFQRQPGVVATCVGYTAGTAKNPTYTQVCSGSTGHTEAVQMTYNPEEVSYQELVQLFYKGHDATTLNRQKGDAGTQYRSGIYTHDQEQLQIAEAAKATVPGAVTEIKPLDVFYPAEVSHQQYLELGGRNGNAQSARKMCNDPIRCYG